MKYQEAVDLGLDTYVPDNPCERGHYHRIVLNVRKSQTNFTETTRLEKPN